MKIINIINCLILSFTLFSNIVLAENTDASQQFKELHQDITRGNIELTKEVHEFYWELLEKVYPGKSEQVVSVFKDTRNSFGRDFQIETWKSAKLSNELGKVTKTPYFVDLESSLIHRVAEKAGFKKGSEEYKSFIKDKNLNTPIALTNAIGIINAAVDNSILSLPNGNELLVNKETIDLYLKGIEQSDSIINKLFNKNWSK